MYPVALSSVNALLRKRALAILHTGKDVNKATSSLEEMRRPCQLQNIWNVHVRL